MEKAKIAADTVEESAARKTNGSGGTSDCDAARGVQRGDDTESSGDDHQLRA